VAPNLVQRLREDVKGRPRGRDTVTRQPRRLKSDASSEQPEKFGNYGCSDP